MTKNDFERIAKSVYLADITDTDKHLVASSLAIELRETNNNFNYDRFKEACVHGTIRYSARTERRHSLVPTISQ